MLLLVLRKRRRNPMGSGPTRFRKREVARIVEGIKMSGAVGTFEFQLAEGVVIFHMTGGESCPGPTPTDKPPNPWDKVLDGKSKLALTVLKKVP
jgi:hypothetical protein